MYTCGELNIQFHTKPGSSIGSLPLYGLQLADLSPTPNVLKYAHEPCSNILLSNFSFMHRAVEVKCEGYPFINSCLPPVKF